MKKTFDEEWEDVHSSQKWGQYPAEHVIRFMARNYYDKERSDVKVLDFGCGGGANTWYLAREGFDVYAFDGSRSAVKNTEKKLEKEGVKAHLLVSDAMNLEYDNNFFDIIIDNACITSNTISNMKDMYKECYNLLKSGGKLMTMCVGLGTDGYLTGTEIEKNTYKDIKEGKWAWRGTAHFCSEEEIKHILTEVGFEELDVDFVIYSDGQIKVEEYVVSAIKK